jgi:cytochrome c biogenesis protein CcmG/thiol:disulfide interchange protein DsbE
VTRGRIAGAVVAVALVLAAVVALRPAHDAAAVRPAPALPRQVLRAPATTLATLRGHAVLVNFWASWCHPCQKEAPALTAFARQAPGVRIVGVDTGDNAGDARRFVASHHWTFPVLRDGDDSVGDDYGIHGLPTTFAVDARGRIVRTLVGPQTVKTLDAALAAASA